MLFKELIQHVNFEDVWKVLDRGYKHKEGAYEVYKRVMEELQELEVSPNKSAFTLVVAKIEDSFEPGAFTFDVFGVKEGESNRYALEMDPWEAWIKYNVLDKSIETYGAAEVVAHAIYEMTFFGYSAQAVAKRVDEERQLLIERHEEVESGKTTLISLEKLREELGVADNRTEAEIEQQQRDLERIIAGNEKVYRELLGERMNWSHKPPEERPEY